MNNFHDLFAFKIDPKLKKLDLKQKNGNFKLNEDPSSRKKVVKNKTRFKYLDSAALAVLKA